MRDRSPSAGRSGRRASAVFVLSLCLPLASGCAAGSRYGGPPPVAPSSPYAGGARMQAVSASTESESVSDGDEAPAAPAPAAESAPGQAAPPPPEPAQAALGNTVAHAPAPAARGPAGRTTPAASTTPATTVAPAVTEGAPPAPMLIYTAAVDLSVRRAEVTATLDRVVDLAYAMGGYLVQRTDAQVQVRVPSARFREGVRRVEELAEVLHRTINAQDVSEEFNDLEVRLTNLRAVRRRLEEFLARAANIAEALRVEQELERVTQEMDRIEGRMRFLRARATFSLVTVTARARSEAVVAPDPLPGPSVRRPLDLPVEWLDRLGLGRLLQIR